MKRKELPVTGVDCPKHSTTSKTLKVAEVADYVGMGTQSFHTVLHRLQHLKVCLDVPDQVIWMMLTATRLDKK